MSLTRDFCVNVEFEITSSVNSVECNIQSSAIACSRHCTWPVLASFVNIILIWAASWDSQQNDSAPSEDSDQPGHPPSLTRVFAVRSMGSYGHKLSSCGQRKLWSDWADAQADLSLRWAHMPFCWFCHEAAHIVISYEIYLSHDMTKPTKWVCAQRGLRSAWVSAQSDQSLRCPHEETLDP